MPQGYYEASPNGDRLIGWKADNGIDQAPTVHPAEAFRARLHRPDIIKRLLDAGSVAGAVRDANAALAKTGAAVPRAVAGPESLLPPGVTMAVDRSKLPVVKVTASARSAVPDQKVKSLRLMLDGRRLPGGAGFADLDGKEQAAVEKQEWEVTLPPGRHTLAVLARSTDDTPSFSPPADLLVPAEGTDRPAVHVLAVGVSRYATVKPDLNCAHTDAESVAKAVPAGAKAGVAYRPGRAVAVTNDKATRAGVLAALDAVRGDKGVKPGDLFVFHFAGHGTRDGGEFFLLTHDADNKDGPTLRKTAVSGAELHARLGDVPCQVLVVLDACHSGQVGALPPGSDEAARGLSGAEGVAVMCAALGHETAKEKNGAGVYTAALARTLADPLAASAFYDHKTGEFNVYHLQAFVYQEVVREAEGQQTPYIRMPLGHPAFTVNLFPR